MLEAGGEGGEEPGQGGAVTGRKTVEQAGLGAEQVRAAGELADKAATAFHLRRQHPRRKRGHAARLYNTMHHWGAITVPPGYTSP